MNDIKELEWNLIKLEKLVSIKTGKLNSNAANPNGKYSFFTCSQQEMRTDTYSFDVECVLLGGNNANGIFPIHYFKGKFDAYQRTYIIESLDKSILLNKFLFYTLELKLEYLKNISTGATTKFLTLAILNNLKLNIPPLSIQQKFVKVLSPFDDLIRNNNIRIEILEKLSQCIFHNLFDQINLIFENDLKDDKKKHKNLLKLKKVEDVVLRLNSGKVYKSNDVIKDGRIIVIDQSTKKFLGFHNNKADHFASIEEPIIIFGDHTCKTQILIDPFSVGPNVIPLKTNLESFIQYLYFFIKNSIMTQGYKRHWTDLKNKKIVIPSEQTLEKFCGKINPIIEMINILTKKNHVLKTIRNFLITTIFNNREILINI